MKTLLNKILLTTSKTLSIQSFNSVEHASPPPLEAPFEEAFEEASQEAPETLRQGQAKGQPKAREKASWQGETKSHDVGPTGINRRVVRCSREACSASAVAERRAKSDQTTAAAEAPEDDATCGPHEADAEATRDESKSSSHEGNTCLGRAQAGTGHPEQPRLASHGARAAESAPTVAQCGEERGRKAACIADDDEPTCRPHHADQQQQVNIAGDFGSITDQ